MKKKRTVVIDGDLIAFQCSAAAEDRSILVTHEPTGVKKSFKNRTEFKKKMQERGKEITEDYHVEDVQEPESPAFCFKVIKQKIENIKRDLEADEVLIFAGEEDNFRAKLPLPSPYKGNRKNSLRPLLLTEAKSYLQRTHKAQKAFSQECDDEITIASYEALAKGHDAYLVTIDHDSFQTDGVHLVIGDKEPVLVPEIGFLTYEKGKEIKGLGLKYFMHQIASGDRTDNLMPYEVAKKLNSELSFGAKSSYDILNPLETGKEIIEAVLNLYQDWYKGDFTYTAWDGTEINADWKFMLELYYAALRMKRTKEDDLNPKHLFAKYGIEYENSKYREQIIIGR